MRIKILMVGDDPAALTADIQLLRDKNLLVYTSFDTDNLIPLIEEIQPDLVFINPQNENLNLTEVYNTIVNNTFFNFPVVYTLSEDDIYLVTRKKGKGKRKVIADNMLAAIKLALQYSDHSSPKSDFEILLPIIVPSFIYSKR